MALITGNTTSSNAIDPKTGVIASSNNYINLYSHYQQYEPDKLNMLYMKNGKGKITKFTEMMGNTRFYASVNRNQSQIRIEFDPARRPATRASLSRCHPHPMCNSSFRLAFQRCREPAVAFVQQRDHADAGAGADRTTITNVTSQSIAQSPQNSAAKISRDSCNDTVPNTR